MQSANATRSAFGSIPRSAFGSKRGGSIPRSDFGGIQDGSNPGRLGQQDQESESEDEPVDPEEIKREQDQLAKATKIKDTPGLKTVCKFADMWEEAVKMANDEPKWTEL